MDFRQAYDDNVAFVWRSLRRLGVREASLKDGVQDVFVVVHRRLPTFEERAHVRTWLFRICMRTAKDYRRRAHTRREVFDESCIEREVASGPNAIEAIEQREALVLFEAAVSHLQFDQRTVFILFELEEMTGERIAECLEIPLGTVYSRLRLAREAFRKAVLIESRARPGTARVLGDT